MLRGLPCGHLFVFFCLFWLQGGEVLYHYSCSSCADKGAGIQICSHCHCKCHMTSIFLNQVAERISVGFISVFKESSSDRRSGGGRRGREKTGRRLLSQSMTAPGPPEQPMHSP